MIYACIKIGMFHQFIANSFAILIINMDEVLLRIYKMQGNNIQVKLALI